MRYVPHPYSIVLILLSLIVAGMPAVLNGAERATVQRPASSTSRNTASALPADQLVVPAKELEPLVTRVRTLEQEVASLRTELQRLSATHQRLQTLMASHVHEATVANYNVGTLSTVQSCKDCVIAFSSPGTSKTRTVVTSPPMQH